MYGAAASWRRRWYARDPSRSAGLTRPVVSVGNLRVGGTGKTPVVAHLARCCVAHGERPAILTRGYARTSPTDGVTVVSNGRQILTDLASAGDEPLMLARRCRVPVLVGADRFACGQRAEREFGVTVHVLDDGFQHLTLAQRRRSAARRRRAISTDRVLPAGRLREPLANAAAAHALLVTHRRCRAVDACRAVARRRGRVSCPRARFTRRAGSAARPSARAMSDRVSARLPASRRPERFFADLRRRAGWQLPSTMAFRRSPSVHPARRRCASSTRRAPAGAAFVVTTEKDAVRLEGLDFRRLPVAAFRCTVTDRAGGAVSAAGSSIA